MHPASPRARDGFPLPRGVVADDLTGAMDAGLELARSAGKTRVALEAAITPELRVGAAAVVLDTESRNLPPGEARKSVERAGGVFSQEGIPLAFKKIDSTLRGNIGAELEALLLVERSSLAVLAAALPSHGRATLQGLHRVRGVPLAETEFANDSRNPVRSSRIRDIVGRQTLLPCAEIGIDAVRRGGEILAGAIAQTGGAGSRIVALDAEKDADLSEIARAILLVGARVLPCGSAGLMKALAMSWACAALPASLTLPHLPPKPVLVICGSPARATRSQVAHAVQELASLEYVALDLHEVFRSPGASLEEADRVARIVERAVGEGRHVIVDGAPIGREEAFRMTGGNPAALDARGAAIRGTLGAIASRIADLSAQLHLVIVGGDTAFSVCRALGAKAVEIVAEVETGIPLGILIGGVADGTSLVTKAGGFGGEASIARIIGYLGGGRGD